MINNKLFVLITLLFAGIQHNSFSQGVIISSNKTDHLEKVSEWRTEKDEKYKDPAKTMFTKELLKDFSRLKYYDVDYTYRVPGKLTLYNDNRTFAIQTTGGQVYQYLIYGQVSFILRGKSLTLNVYQSQRSAKSGNKSGALFIPFTDKTSGSDTYGGGRYLVLDIPDSDILTLDFNMAYNPYCVYDPEHSCPIPPKENKLDVLVEVGEKMYP